MPVSQVFELSFCVNMSVADISSSRLKLLAILRRVIVDILSASERFQICGAEQRAIQVEEAEFDRQ